MPRLISVLPLLSKLQMLVLHIFMVVRCLVFVAYSVVKSPA